MEYQQYPRRELEDIKLLWACGFWDGATSGMLLMDGRKYWFEMVEESDQEYTNFYRRFAIIELTEAQAAEEEKWHQLFREKVGTHMDYDGEPWHEGKIRPHKNHAEFYDAYKQWQQPNYLENAIVGWFEQK